MSLFRFGQAFRGALGKYVVMEEIFSPRQLPSLAPQSVKCLQTAKDKLFISKIMMLDWRDRPLHGNFWTTTGFEEANDAFAACTMGSPNGNIIVPRSLPVLSPALTWMNGTSLSASQSPGHNALEKNPQDTLPSFDRLALVIEGRG
ncbi:hypothetical protein BDV12DRAFT_167100 [Aspergillus spectabilis]